MARSEPGLFCKPNRIKGRKRSKILKPIHLLVTTRELWLFQCSGLVQAFMFLQPDSGCADVDQSWLLWLQAPYFDLHLH